MSSASSASRVRGDFEFCTVSHREMRADHSTTGIVCQTSALRYCATGAKGKVNMRNGHAIPPLKAVPTHP
jgi:hypothetical protein